MLNELYDLKQSMERAGIELVSLNPTIQPYGKGEVFYIYLDRDCQIASIGYETDPDVAARLRKFQTSRGGLQESTLGFAVDPLRRCKGRDPEAQKDLSKRVKRFAGDLDKGKTTEPQRRERLAELGELTERNWPSPVGAKAGADKIGKCLKHASKVLLEVLTTGVDDAPDELRPTTTLLNRMQALTATGLYEGALAVAARQVERCGPNDHAAALVRFAFADKSVLVFELAESLNDEDDSVHPRAYKHINQRLLGAWGIPSDTVRTPDIFGGSAVIGEDKMPSVRLARFGDVILRSLNHTHRHQFRYGLVEDQACPISRETQLELAAALRWLADGEGRTWESVRGTCGPDRNAILFSYPGNLSETPPEVAAMLGGTVNPDDPEGVRFEALAATVMPALRGERIDQHVDLRAEIRAFVLSKQDKARTKVAVGRRFRVQGLARASTDWQDGCENIPPIRVLRKAANGRAHWQSPITPTPTDVVRCLNRVWTSDGQKSIQAENLSIADGLNLFLEEGARRLHVSRQTLRVLLRSATTFLVSLGHVHHMMARSGRVPRDLFALTNPRYSLLLPSIAGLLLHKLGYAKGDYMKSSAYRVGQLLSLADSLHREYCLHVRAKDGDKKGAVPPQLLGNGIFATALDSPKAGLARLAERLPLYPGWANAALGEGAGLAKYFLSEMRKIASHFDDEHLKSASGDEDKAQMLLGYLAGPEQKQEGEH